MVNVQLKRPNGWNISSSDVDEIDDVDYAIVQEGQIKKIAVLVREEYRKCSKCDSKSCSHVRAVEDLLPGVPA